MKLNKRIFLLLPGIAILLNACHHNAKPQEHYDTVSITTYNNTYDSIGRLVNVQAMEKLTIYYDKDKGYTPHSILSQAIMPKINRNMQSIYSSEKLPQKGKPRKAISFMTITEISFKQRTAI